MGTRPALSVLAGASMLLVATLAARAADPDWPCAQRLVPQLSAGAFWAGPPPGGQATGSPDPALADLAAAVTPRDVPVEQGEAKLAAFADAVPEADRPQRLRDAFGALLQATNEERTAVVDRIKALTRRQRDAGEVVARVTDELRAIPPDATGADAGRRAEIVERRALLIRGVEETQRTLRYACEVPAELDARLGRYARLLQSKL